MKSKYKNSKSLDNKEKNLERIILEKFEKIKKKDLNEIKNIVKKQISYKNTLWNLKDFMEELKEYDEKNAINFFKIILKKKKNKIWFMSKRNAKTDFKTIIGTFKDKNKTKTQKLYLNQIKIHQPKLDYIDNPNEILKANELIKKIIKIEVIGS
ncbi:Hypothetical protein BCO_0016301 (plasmid) [Borrelia coriaceae ATCC 43381]|uniref:Uncharacterized protein n=2 Tax=Borrelia coriaceae TaxID=144 RepID=W5T1Y2_9SPIR|nr:Hypothetical protein BCO_0016301 [Borrelia coriaceae ATCC 43381]